MTRDALIALFDRFEAFGPRDLAVPDRLRLAQLIQSDSRCCAHLPRTLNDRRSRSRFLRWLKEAWLNEPYFEVLDYRRRLLRAASQHKRRREPFVALLLYATWIEHTVNAVVIGAARMTQFRGHTDDLSRRIVAATFPERVSKLWAQYQAPTLDRILRKRLVHFMEVRNGLVHYKWIGLDPDALANELAHMRTLVANVGSIINALRGSERQVTTLRFRPRIRRLLGIHGSRANSV